MHTVYDLPRRVRRVSFSEFRKIMRQTPSGMAACRAATQSTAAAARLGNVGKTQAYQNRTKLRPPMFPRNRPPLPPQARRTRPTPSMAPLPASRGQPSSADGAALTTASVPPLRPPLRRELSGDGDLTGDCDDPEEGRVGRSQSQPTVRRPSPSMQAPPAGVAEAAWRRQAEAEWATDVEEHARRREEVEAKAEAARVRKRTEAAAIRARLEEELADVPAGMLNCVLKTHTLLQ